MCLNLVLPLISCVPVSCPLHTVQTAVESLAAVTLIFRTQSCSVLYSAKVEASYTCDSLNVLFYS